MLKTLSYNIRIANEAILQNKTRSFLTSLGIIFGVASVITMLAIGKGAEQEILEKMKVLGTNNIIVKPIKKQINGAENDQQKEEEVSDKKEAGAKKYSPGLTITDAESIQKIVPGVEAVIPEIIFEQKAIRNSYNTRANLIGIESSYFKGKNTSIIGNGFSKVNHTNADPVCIIGDEISKKLFPTEKPLGKSLKINDVWFKVVGIVASRNISKDNAKSLGVRNYDSDIYIPINTMLMRIENRSKLTSLDVRQGYKRSSMNTGNYHQLDQLTVRVKNTDEIQTVAEIIKKMLTRRHNGVEDFEMVIPELLLKQEQDTKQIFNFVLGAIASISLIVGGIGIMNIMLASVLERTKEIGIRMAVGAKKTDVMTQFLSEAVAISISGGIIGIILGISASYAIEMSTEIKTFVSVWSVLISFVVSISVGLIFGILPAKKAANQDPIDLLRYE